MKYFQGIADEANENKNFVRLVTQYPAINSTAAYVVGKMTREELDIKWIS